MVGFKSLLVVGAAALAAFASPLLVSDNALVTRGAPVSGYTELAARDFTPLDDAILPRAEAADATAHGGRPEGGSTIAEIIVAVHVEIKVIVSQIQHAVKSKADVKVLIDLILKINVTLNAAMEKFRHHRGKPSRNDIDVSIFVDIFISIMVSLNTAVKGCRKNQVQVLLRIMVQLNITISAFLKTCFGYAPGLDANFAARLNTDVVAIVKGLNLVDVVAVIKVHLSIRLKAILGA